MTRTEDLVEAYLKSNDTAKVILKGLESGDVEEFYNVLIDRYKKELQEETDEEKKQKLEEKIQKIEVYKQNHRPIGIRVTNNSGNYNNCNFKKNKSIREFKGLESDFNLWVADIERVARSGKLNEIETYYLAIENLGKAQRPIADSFEGKQITEDKEPSWNAFKQLMERMYAPINKIKSYRDKLARIKLSNFDRITRFHDEFIKLISCIGESNLTEQEILTYYRISLDKNEVSTWF